MLNDSGISRKVAKATVRLLDGFAVMYGTTVDYEVLEARIHARWESSSGVKGACIDRQSDI